MVTQFRDVVWTPFQGMFIILVSWHRGKVVVGSNSHGYVPQLYISVQSTTSFEESMADLSEMRRVSTQIQRCSLSQGGYCSQDHVTNPSAVISVSVWWQEPSFKWYPMSSQRRIATHSISDSKTRISLLP